VGTSTVWTSGGCASWYLDSRGRNTTLWPRLGVAFRAITRRFDLEPLPGVRAGAGDLTAAFDFAR